MSTSRPFVCVVDDDESVRESLPDLLKELGYDVEAFSSAERFLESGRATEAQCLVLDVSMPGMSGPELQRELQRRGIKVPIVFITAYADASVRPTLLERGAIDCLFKPFDETELIAALAAALSSHDSETDL